MEFLKKIFGDYNQKKLNELWPIVEQVNNYEADIKSLGDEALRAKTDEFKEKLSAGASLDDILPEAYAVVREAARRTLGQRHFDVQVLGGVAMHQGSIAEMRTGEGKTLVATLPAYLNALTGKGVHVVTVNDYLSRRDVVWMGQIYESLGLSTGAINQDQSYLYDSSQSAPDEKRDLEGGYQIYYEYLRPVERKEAYQADITYGTNNEFGFDYLRDNLAYDPEKVVQRTDTVGRYNFAIIDEVDSILIDEARTPLIISAPVSESEQLYGTFAKIASQLQPEKHYTIDEKLKAATLTQEGISRAEEILGVENIYTDRGIKYVHHLETAVRAKALFLKERDYVIRDGEVVIVDEFTGRLQPGRRWSEGLHQAIEAKEGVKINQESRTFATVTFQNYFRLYEKLAGMTGTAMTSSEEFDRVYGLEVVGIPTNRPNQREDLEDLIFQTEQGKFKAIARKIKELNSTGQPVLVGTVSIEKNELLSAYLSREGVGHQILNAKNHEQEGKITASAGKKGSVVIATNMAGRGVDIKLGGPNPSEEDYEEVKSLGGLFVIGTERHEARRIDNQLRGRTARQGDPGQTQFFISLEDSLMRVFASDRIKNMMGRFGIPEDEPVKNRFISRGIENAQNKIEGMNFDTRKHLLEYDDVINHQRLTVYNRRRKLLFGGPEEVYDLLALAWEESTETDETDEAKTGEFLNDIKAKLAQEDTDPPWWQNARQAILQIIDMLWVEHLESVDYMKSSVKLRAFGQRDPLVEYKKEGLRMFKEMEQSMYDRVIKIVPNLGSEAIRQEARRLREIHRSAQLIGGGNSNKNENSNVTGKEKGAEQKVGRNDPCPCGATKADGTPVKYKKCHGAGGSENS